MKKLILLIMLLFLTGCKNEVQNSEMSKYKSNYYGYLIIPSINMTYGFYDTLNEFNDVNKNVTLLKSNIKNTYILAAHSGSSYLAYFNDLKFLKINDKVYLKFGNTTLEYNVVNIKSEKKNGKIKIKNKENQLILTTCDQVRKGNQLIIESDLIIDKTSSN